MYGCSLKSLIVTRATDRQNESKSNSKKMKIMTKSGSAVLDCSSVDIHRGIRLKSHFCSMMKPLVFLVFAEIFIFPICLSCAQTTSVSPTVTSSAQPTSASNPKTSNKRKTENAKDEAAIGHAQEETWKTAVGFPIIRLLGIAIVIGGLLWFLDLRHFLKSEAWTDRTVIALILVFSFAAATMINVNPSALSALKDVTLIVVGFYFGAARATSQLREKDKDKDKNERKEKDADKGNKEQKKS
jgi:hypothetical protein